MKQCTKCKKQKNEKEFGKHSQIKSGLYPSCKICRRIRYNALYNTLNGHYCNECGRELKGRQTNYCPVCYGKHINKKLEGLQIGRLIVLRFSHREKRKDNTGYRRFWLCKCSCGNEKIINQDNLTRKNQTLSCGCLRNELSGQRAHKMNWKGGRTIGRGGYVILRTHKDHPNATKLGIILEHRYVMSEFLGRPLLKTEIVHHKNGNTSDNKIDNLELMTFRKNGGNGHTWGQSIIDMVKFCKDYLIQYEKEAELLAKAKKPPSHI